jgi:hypothetical protein
VGRTSGGVFVAVESEGRIIQFFLTEIVARLMGFWAPHAREAVEVFGADRVMFGTDYGPVPDTPHFGAERGFRQPGSLQSG